MGSPATGVPLIHFGVGATPSSPTSSRPAATSSASTGGSPRRCVEVDRRDRGIQGNLDPARLFGPARSPAAGADDILRRAGGRPGHIFNLGHGVLPQTPVESLQALADHVHATIPVRRT